jgi:hypothetical protein
MDIIFSLLEFVINLGAITLIMIGVFLFMVKYRLTKIHHELEETMRRLESEQLIPLTVEVDQNQYLCYNSVTKAFVCQGNNLKEIIERFRLRYPNKNAAIYDGDENAVKTLKQQLKDMYEDSSSIRPAP